MKWKTIQSEEAFRSKYVSVRKDIVEMPSGVRMDDYYTVCLPDASSIVAVTEDNEIVLKREYRYAVKEETIEIPAGTFNSGEKDPLQVAQRELMEETGFSSDTWVFLGETMEHTAKLTSRMYIFWAKGCKLVAKQSLDPTEQISFFTVPIEEAVQMVLRDEIKCNTSSRAILQVARIIEIENSISERK